LVELELLNDQVEIVKESLLNVLSDIIIQSWLDVEWLVRLFNFLDPHVEGVKFLLDKVIKVVGGIEDSINRTHEEREECKSHELKSDRENIFLGSRSRVITIPNCGDNFENPIESKNVLSWYSFVVELILVNP